VIKAVLAAVIGIVFFGSPLQATAKVAKSDKKIIVYLASQAMRCYQGDEVVLSTRVSTGKGWRAPGSKEGKAYRASYAVLAKDPRKAEATSKLVDEDGNEVIAKTPWKLILSYDYGHYVRIHGYHSVPRRPASHGCVRVPIKQAEDVFKFADPGTPVYIEAGRAPGSHKTHKVAKRHRTHKKPLARPSAEKTKTMHKRGS
jgi:lipoprotein-anchoring transpeptidase ErfK/SrfK